MIKSHSEAFRDWVKEMDKVLSETQNLTIDGQPMEASDDHFKTQTKSSKSHKTVKKGSG